MSELPHHGTELSAGGGEGCCRTYTDQVLTSPRGRQVQGKSSGRVNMRGGGGGGETEEGRERGWSKGEGEGGNEKEKLTIYSMCTCECFNLILFISSSLLLPHF